MTSNRPTILGHQHMVAAGHYLAAEAGYAVLEAGGNAVDAGVASAMCLGVVQSDLVGFGGVAPMMIRDPSLGELVTIDGLGWWPEATDINRFIDEFDGLVPRGILRTVVPGAPAAFIAALERFGTMSFGEVAFGAIRAARDGFVMYDLLASTIAEHEHEYREYEENTRIYLPNDAPPKVGSVFRLEKLAATIQFMADQEQAAGGDRKAGLAAARHAFYEGDIAQTIDRFHRENGGWLTLKDLAGYSVTFDQSVTTRFADATVHACGPWCQGPALTQVLAILEGFDLEALGHNSAAYIHVVAEAIKLVFHDREEHYGDPRHVDVPIDRLTSSQHAAHLRDRIDRARATPHGELWDEAGEQELVGEGALDTSYTCAIDSDGLVFSCTPSDGSSNTPVVPELGMCLSSRGSQSRADPDHPSSIAPGKRPRLTPNPAIAVCDDGRVVPFGTPGADVQIQAMAQALTNLLVFGMSPQDAVGAPRFSSYSYPQSFAPHNVSPDLLRMEESLVESHGARLSELGHKVEAWPEGNWRAGAVCMIARDGETGVMGGGADPRRPCYVLGW